MISPELLRTLLSECEHKLNELHSEVMNLEFQLARKRDAIFWWERRQRNFSTQIRRQAQERNINKRFGGTTK